VVDLGLQGRKALVFGGSRGLGRAAAEALAREGAQVTIAARDAKRLAMAAQELGAAWIAADISSESGRSAALDACPGPDILINNADAPLPGDFRAWERGDWLQALDALALGPIEMIRGVVDGMIERRWGRILNVSSRSIKVAQAELGLSNGARSVLAGFCAGLARQVARHNVTVNNILPGVFATDAQRRHIQGMLEPGGQSFEEVWEERRRRVPAARYGEAFEFGDLAAYLCSAQAGFITGQSVLIDGGQYPGTF